MVGFIRFLCLLSLAMALLVVSGCRHRSRGTEGESAASIENSTIYIHFNVLPEPPSYSEVVGDVFLDDGLIGNVENGDTVGFDAPVGQHALRVAASGYGEEEKSILVLDTGHQSFHFTLTQSGH